MAMVRTPTKKAHIEEPRVMIELINTESLITRLFCIKVSDDAMGKYPAGWELSPTERSSRDLFDRTYRGYARRHA